MKLFSSRSSKGRHVIKGNAESAETSKSKKAENKVEDTANTKNSGEKMTTRKKVIITISSIFGLILLLGAGAAAVIYWEVQPLYDYFFKPDVTVLTSQPVLSNNTVVVDYDPVKPDVEQIQHDNVEAEQVVERDPDRYTFLVFGIDLHGNTDVIMVATFDAVEHTLEVVSIPRDTVVNVPWSLRKVNSIHAYARNMFKDQNMASDDVARETFAHFRNILGYNIDFLITISMGAFPRIVDAIGPIEFNVPRSVNLEGVRVARGNQRLNGQQALAVMRDRNAHSDGDIGRATAQQDFLHTVMRQMLKNRSSIKVEDMADIFLRHTNTNIQLNHLVWLGKEFLKIDADNINFSMMPGEFEDLRGNFYITIQLDPWLELVNAKLSPLKQEITPEDVSILTRGPDRKLYVTDDNWQGDRSWGASSTGSSNPQTTTGS